MWQGGRKRPATPKSLVCFFFFWWWKCSKSQPIPCDFEAPPKVQQKGFNSKLWNRYPVHVYIFIYFFTCIYSQFLWNTQPWSVTTVRTCWFLSAEVKATHFDGLMLNRTQVSDHVTLSCFCLDIFSDMPPCQTSGVIGGLRTNLFTFLRPVTRRGFFFCRKSSWVF